MPGPGGPAGMSAALTKLFGDIKAFTAKVEAQVLDTNNTQIASMPMDFAVLDGKIRVEMDLTQSKNRAMPPGMADQLKQMKMAHVISLIRPDLKKVYVMYPDQKVMLAGPYEEESVTVTPEATSLGKEVIDGHPCDKAKVRIADPRQKLDATTWRATDLKNFPIQIETKDQGMTSFLRFRQVQLSKPDAKLFDAPTDFTEYQDQMALMQGVMKKMGEPGKK